MKPISGKPLKVLIIGGGTGGLCLAHGLRKAGVAVKVFERDHTPEDRLQGYRLNISSTGNRALAACLPSANYQRFVAGSAKSSTGVSFFDEQLNRLLQIQIPEAGRNSIESERPVSRITLRKVMLDGLEDLVEFGKKFDSYETSSDGAVANFADGSSAHGDILVGADGAGSRVARQLLPGANRIDTGFVVISGRFALDEAARLETPAAVFRGPTLIMGPAGFFMFASAVEYSPESVPIYDRDEYVMWGVSARREDFHFDGKLEALEPETAKHFVLKQIGTWAPELRRMIERADPKYVSAFAVKSARDVEPWPTTRVTLLGDALHNMTPFRGMGANAALYDAAQLTNTITNISPTKAELIPALAAYEKDIVEHGFTAVRSSLSDMERLHSQSPLKRLATKMVFHLVDAIPPLHRAFRGQR